MILIGTTDTEKIFNADSSYFFSEIRLICDNSPRYGLTSNQRLVRPIYIHLFYDLWFIESLNIYYPRSLINCFRYSDKINNILVNSNRNNEIRIYGEYQ